MPDIVTIALHHGHSEIAFVTITSPIQPLNNKSQSMSCDHSANLINIATNLTDYILKGYQYGVTVSLVNCAGSSNTSRISFGILYTLACMIIVSLQCFP